MKSFWIVIGILSLMILSFFIGKGIGLGTYGPEETSVQTLKSLNTDSKVIQFFINRTTISNQGIHIDCSNLDLELTSICLNYYVNQIFQYNLTDDSISLNEYELRKDGGDCKNWVEFLEKKFLKYGYDTDRVKIKVSDPVIKEGVAIEVGMDHVFIVAHNEERYCILDMTQQKCFSYDDIVAKRF